MTVEKVGKRLIEAKRQLTDESWAGWLKENVNFTIRTAQRFMKCADRFGEATTSSHLNPSQMMELLSLPEQEAKEFIEQKKSEGNPVEDMTIKALRQEIKDWKDKAQKAENEALAAKNKCDAQAKEIQDLKNNPTVVETPANSEYVAKLENDVAKAKSEARKANLDYEMLQDKLEELDKRGGDAIRERDKYAQMAEEIAGELKQAQELNKRLLAEKQQPAEDILTQALSELKAFEEKYNALPELAGVLAEVQKLIA